MIEPNICLGHIKSQILLRRRKQFFAPSNGRLTICVGWTICSLTIKTYRNLLRRFLKLARSSVKKDVAGYLTVLTVGYMKVCEI